MNTTPSSCFTLSSTAFSPRSCRIECHSAILSGSQLGRISRRGDSYVRRFLIQGAHSILKRIDTQDGRRAQWLHALVARCGKQVAAVALANKNARIAWQLLRYELQFEEDYALAA